MTDSNPVTTLQTYLQALSAAVEQLLGSNFPNTKTTLLEACARLDEKGVMSAKNGLPTRMWEDICQMAHERLRAEDQEQKLMLKLSPDDGCRH